MDEQNKDGIFGSGETGIEDNSEFILSQVSPDIEKRDMRDVLSLIEAAFVSKDTPVKKLDLWGQAIFSAFRQAPIPAEIEQWVSQGISLARQQLVKRLDQLHLDPDLTRQTLDAIIKVYQTGSPVYKKYNLEAFRVAQIYFYDFLLDTKKAPSDLVEEEKAYTFCIGVQAVGFANIAECHIECLAMCNILQNIYDEIKSSGWLDSQPYGMRKGIDNGIFVVGFNATKAAAKTGRFPEALEWSIRTEPFALEIDDAWMQSDYFVRRGEVLIELGQADEALNWLQKALAAPGLTPQEVNDVKKRVGFAQAQVSGDLKVLFKILFVDVLSEGEIKKLCEIIEAAISGNKEWADISRFNEILEKYLTSDSLDTILEKTSLHGMAQELKEVKRRLTVQFARAALQDGSLSKLDGLIPGIKKLAESDSPEQLHAVFFLIRYQQYKGEAVTWQSISSSLSRLFKIPKSRILDYLLDVSAILLEMEPKEMLKAAGMIAALVKDITLDEEEERTLTGIIRQTAFSIDIIDAFLTLLVAMTDSDYPATRWWLEQVSRLKYRTGYRGQRLQKEAELFRFSTELTGDTVCQIKDLAETLTRCSLGTGGTENPDMIKQKDKLMTLLYPLYSRYRPQGSDREYDVNFPEIIHIETANYLDKKNHEAPVISVVLTGDRSEINCPDVVINRFDAISYTEFLGQPISLDFIVEVGMNLKKALLPAPVDGELPYLMGVRSTGIYHCVPIDTLPLTIDEETNGITQWVGEKMTAVLLTGWNKDLEILEEPLMLKSIAVFANSSFTGEFMPLPGALKEAEAIESILREAGNASVPMPTDIELFLEQEANRENFLRLTGENAPQVLHIACHGIIHEESPSFGFIVLSDMNSREEPMLGAVGYHDIILMDLRECDLVILSACSTHEGKSVLGEGIMGLAWAFKAAGAKAVIATRWQVDDEAAVAFWRKFYESLCNNRLSTGKAFHDARQHIIRQEKWRHPYYWGVFQLIV